MGSLDQYFPGEDAVLARLMDEHHRQVHQVQEHSALEGHGHAAGEQFHRRVVALFDSRPEEAGVAAVFGETDGTLMRWLVHEAPRGIDAQAMEAEAVRMLTRFLLDG